MAHITFSVVTTVFNEEKSIEVLLRSLLNQSLQPGEIIVVDAGSTDDTVQLTRSIERMTSIPIHTMVCSGVNRSVGRNIGIKSAVNPYIAVIDAGCEADARWLEELSIGFKEDVQAVAGFYTPLIQKPIQRLFAAYVSTLPRDMNEATYFPSSRSLAFTKEVWQTVGGYPEHLNTCEDLVFAVKLKKTGKMVVCRNALVLWRQAEGYSDFFTQIRGYARGDIQAHYYPHILKIVSIWLRYGLFVLYPLLFLIYIWYPIVKHRREITNIREALQLPLIQFTSDGAVMLGSFDAD